MSHPSPPMITSRDNPRLKAIRRLNTSKGRRRTRGLLLEGPHLVQTALEEGLQLDLVLLTPEFEQQHPHLVESFQDLDGLEVARVDSKLLEELADVDSPRGLIASATRPDEEVERVLGAVESQEQTWLLLDGVQDPGNLGAMARSAEASGARGLFLLGEETVSWRHPRALRASAGSLLRLPCCVVRDVAEVDAALARLATSSQSEPESQVDQLQWVALEARAGNALWTAELGRRVILCVGGEAHGLGEQAASRCDLTVSIPTAGVESLNAAVAASLVLFELDRRRRGEASTGASPLATRY